MQIQNSTSKVKSNLVSKKKQIRANHKLKKSHNQDQKKPQVDSVKLSRQSAAPTSGVEPLLNGLTYAFRA